MPIQGAYSHKTQHCLIFLLKVAFAINIGHKQSDHLFYIVQMKSFSIWKINYIPLFLINTVLNLFINCIHFYTSYT
jgi:hypothetical protein